MNKVLCTVFLLVLVAVASFAKSREMSQGDGPYGRIQGTVVSEEGAPVASAIVYLFGNGSSPMTTTDPDGGFYFQRVPVGNQKIIAYKEAEGFPNAVWSFYSEAYGGKGIRSVHVYGNQRVTRVVINLGTKAGRLLIHVIDAETKQPIKNANVAMIHKGKPKTLFRSGSNRQDGFDVLIPPNIPIEIAVTAPDYQTWHYEKSGIDSIRLSSGAEQDIMVALHH
jgi:hypothetical protein